MLLLEAWSASLREGHSVAKQILPDQRESFLIRDKKSLKHSRVRFMIATQETWVLTC
jgi:hypothetical protein